jgi:hypothetical protein
MIPNITKAKPNDDDEKKKKKRSVDSGMENDQQCRKLRRK